VTLPVATSSAANSVVVRRDLERNARATTGSFAARRFYTPFGVTLSGTAGAFRTAQDELR